MTIPRNIFITGHSLGGAIAQLAALELATIGHNVTLYTFGSPRVGDAGFVNAINRVVSNHYRVTSIRDPVPHVPAQIQGFAHAGVEVFYQSQVNYTICPDMVE